jgi:hypothetical protein
MVNKKNMGEALLCIITGIILIYGVLLGTQKFLDIVAKLLQ